MDSAEIRQMYRQAHPWDPPEHMLYLDRLYVRRENLRYGDNPHQGAALYFPVTDRAQITEWLGTPPEDAQERSEWFSRLVDRFNVVPIKPVVGDYRLLKTGKGGPSATNISDVDRSVRIVSYFDNPACATPKHLNPSGVAVRNFPREAFEKAYGCDSRAAFGSFPTFNCSVNGDTAVAIMESGFIEGVAAPDFTDRAMEVFSDYTIDGKPRNKDIRILGISNLDSIPRFVGDDTHGLLEPRLLVDGSLLVQELYTSAITPGNYREATTVATGRQPNVSEWRDMLFAWRVAPHVRSNGVVIARNEATVAIGTGQQERIGAIEDALRKAREKGHADELPGSVLASDGFMLRDNVEPLHEAGVTAIIQPGGGLSDGPLMEEADKYGIAMVLTGERVFSHF